MSWKRIDAGFVSMVVLALVLAMVLDPAAQTPPPVYHHIPTPVIGHYCVATVEGSKREGIPLGMTIWMSEDMVNPSSPNFACAEMPNPMHGDLNGRK